MTYVQELALAVLPQHDEVEPWALLEQHEPEAWAWDWFCLLQHEEEEAWALLPSVELHSLGGIKGCGEGRGEIR